MLLALLLSLGGPFCDAVQTLSERNKCVYFSHETLHMVILTKTADPSRFATDRLGFEPL
jgi:hypothetical protein